MEWGPKGVRTVAIAPGAFPTPGASGQLRPEGRDESWAHRNPLGRAGEHGELANLASFLISDAAGYINGEMVVQDGGAHLRSSGAEDLLQWTDAQWEKQRAARAKAAAGLTCEMRPARAVTAFPNRHFPVIHRPGDYDRSGPSSSHNHEGTSWPCGGY